MKKDTSADQAKAWALQVLRTLYVFRPVPCRRVENRCSVHLGKELRHFIFKDGVTLDVGSPYSREHAPSFKVDE